MPQHPLMPRQVVYGNRACAELRSAEEELSHRRQRSCVGARTTQASRAIGKGDGEGAREARAW
eukprot:CAMPEP_0180206874 /NCGR_PEP_ID=MMETSP0987-20121128/9793_1 /TAXON_ID=697907 /ORGANISM="non described non described, Strain CCMP2293" /LENGTH=62 /DNA_ID=CAMNT_0022162691 /DNA_START=56 /DNA_END=241 /DNA_ORIENTATION=-